MSKGRFIYLLLSGLLIIPLIIFIEDIEIYFIIGILILISINAYLRRREKSKISNIFAIYLTELDPKTYIEELERYQKNFIFTKKNKQLNQISKANTYLDMGDHEKARALLEELVNIEAYMKIEIKFWYYKAWIYYFDETDDIDRMEFLIDKLKILIKTADYKIRRKLEVNYPIIISRYNVKRGIELDKALKTYEEIYRNNYPRITIVTSVYYIGLILFKQQKYDQAKEKLEAVVRNCDKLNIGQKAQKHLDIINQTETEPIYDE